MEFLRRMWQEFLIEILCERRRSIVDTLVRKHHMSRERAEKVSWEVVYRITSYL